MKRFFLSLFLLSLPAHADAPVIWNGASAKWLPTGLQSAGLCKTSSTGVQTVYTTDGLVKMSSGVPGAASSGTDYQAPISTSASVSHQFLTAFTAPNTFSRAQPAFTDISGSVADAQMPALTGDVTTSAGAVATTVAKIQSTTVSGTTGTTNVVFSSAPTLTNPVVGTQATSDNSTKAASTAFVQTALAQLNPAAAVVAASTANIPGTYTNAVSGVCIGDTFRVTSTSAFAPDGVTLTAGQRFLMKDQSSSFQDGVWTLTTAANVGVLGALLTRALDFDSAESISAGQIIPVSGGTVNAGSSWYQTAAVTTCNSDSQTWTQFQKASSAYASSTLTNTHILVGNGSGVAADVAMSGDVTIGNTGVTAIGASKVTNTMLAGSIDLTAKVTGALPIANGGTAATSKAAGFDALSPMSASGDIIYGGASGTGTRLAKGSDTNVLTLASGVPTWAAPAAGTGAFLAYGEAYFATTASCIVSKTGGSLAAFGTASACPGPIVIQQGGGSLAIQTTDANTPTKVTVNSVPAGVCQVEFHGFGDGNGSATDISFTINDGTTTSDMVMTNTTTANGSYFDAIATFVYGASGNKTFELYGAVNTGTIRVYNLNNSFQRTLFRIKCWGTPT